MQTWKIRGQVYTHAQLMEIKKQGLDPHKDEIIMKFISPNKEVVAPKNESIDEVSTPEPDDKKDEDKVPKEEAETDIRDLKRFEELKAIGYFNLKGALREEYTNLKALLTKA